MASTRQERLTRFDDGQARIVPSLLNCDFGILAAEIDDAKRCGADVIHWDVMDGVFVPNFSYGPVLIDSLRPQSDMIFDVHLMVQDPLRYLDNYLEAGADLITVHTEVLDDPRETLRAIRKRGARAGLALNPPTPIEKILPWLDELDHVLVMSVMPGFGGQKFDSSVLSKVRSISNLRNDIWVEIDGGINKSTVEVASEAGVRLFVVGSAFYNADNRAEAFGDLSRLMQRGRSNRG
ncbi:ribulose-phosphate 3-epimerase [bacterium]|nr:ribulose-phosphate 3-epimerase [bacterium]